MKKIIAICFLMAAAFMVKAQTLSGEYRNDGKSTGSYYTKINWSVSYGFEEKNGNFYIKFHSPKIKVPNYALYHDEYKKEYSLADLGLANWPNARQLPFAMSVKVNVSDGYKNYEVTAGCNADFTCGDNYIVSKANVKNVSLQNFRVTSVTYFRANLGGEPAVDEILKSRRQSAGRTAQNNSANSAQPNAASDNTGTSSSASSSNNSSTSSSDVTVNNNIFAAQNAKKQQEEKAYQDLAKGVFDLFTPSAEQSERNMRELARKMQSKAALDKALEGKKELAKNGDDQSYYDIYSAYKYSFSKEARYYKRLAYSTGNASVFKEENRLLNKSPKGLFVGVQSGEVSLFGVNFLETTNSFGFFMSFRMSVKKVDGDPLGENKEPKNRGIYTDSRGDTYTFLSEAPKSEQGRMVISLGSSYHVYKPLFIYAGVGFGTVNTFSYQNKNNVVTEKRDESFLGGSTDAGIIIKVGRLIALNGGISLMNLKYPEYVAGISFNFFPEK